MSIRVPNHETPTGGGAIPSPISGLAPSVAVETLLHELDAARLTPRYWATFALIVIQLICEIFDFFIVAFLVSAIAPEWGLSFGQTTLILLSAGLGSIFGAIGFGFVADRHGRKVAIVGGAFLYCGAAASIALIPDGAWRMFALLRFLVGAGYGGAGASQFALIAEYTPTRLRTVLTGSLGVPAALGVLFGAIVVAHLLPVLGWRGIAALGGLPVFVAIAIAFVAPESERWRIARRLGRESSAGPRARSGWSELLRDKRRLWLVMLVQLGMGTALTGVVLWGPTIVAQVLRVPPAAAAGYFIWVSLAGLIGRIVFTFLPTRLGRVTCGALVGYAGALFLALAGWFHDAHLGGVPLFPVLLVIGQFFFDGGYSTINPYAAELYPVRLAALGTGVAAAAGGVGKMLGPLMLGLLAGSGNLVTPQATEQAILPGFLFLSVGCLVAALAFSLIGIETHGRPVQVD